MKVWLALLALMAIACSQGQSKPNPEPNQPPSTMIPADQPASGNTGPGSDTQPVPTGETEGANKDPATKPVTEESQAEPFRLVTLLDTRVDIAGSTFFVGSGGLSKGQYKVKGENTFLDSDLVIPLPDMMIPAVMTYDGEKQFMLESFLGGDTEFRNGIAFNIMMTRRSSQRLLDLMALHFPGAAMGYNTDDDSNFYVDPVQAEKQGVDVFRSSSATFNVDRILDLRVKKVALDRLVCVVAALDHLRANAGDHEAIIGLADDDIMPIQIQAKGLYPRWTRDSETSRWKYSVVMDHSITVSYRNPELETSLATEFAKRIRAVVSRYLKCSAAPTEHPMWPKLTAAAAAAGVDLSVIWTPPAR